jgi:4-hydroxybenzoate polyprenyltransferase
VLALLAFLLVLTTNQITVGLSFAALAVTLAYPYAKRYVSMPQAVLGMAFGMGIPMAFAAARGEVAPLAWLLTLGNLFWVLAYDTEYAMVDRDDDLKIGIQTSAITLGRLDLPVVMLCYLLFIGIWAIALVKYADNAIFIIAISVALIQVGWHYTLIRGRSREGCFKAFRLNHWLGLTVFAGIAASYAAR